MSVESESIILLDGGMGQELVRRSANPPTAMWSAGILLHEPDLVRDLHIEFIQAGARVITLNSYSVTPERVARDAPADLFDKLQHSAIEIAQDARDIAGIDGVSIAGCLPPLVGSYRADIAPDFESSVQTYRKIVACQAAHVDVFLAETVASVAQAKAVATAALESGKPVWIALTVADDNNARLRSGEDLTAALQALEPLGVQAVLLNCSKPEAISASWEALSSYSGLLGAYANGFTSIDALAPGGTVDLLDARVDLDPKKYAEFVMSWIQQGANIVGGCCEVGPQHIAELNHQLKAAGRHVSGLQVI